MIKSHVNIYNIALKKKKWYKVNPFKWTCNKMKSSKMFQGVIKIIFDKMEITKTECFLIP